MCLLSWVVPDDHCQSFDGGYVFLFVFGRGWHNLLERLEEVRSHHNVVVVFGDDWDRPVRWEKVVGSCDAVFSGCWNIHSHQYVVVRDHTGDVCFNDVGRVRVVVVGRNERSYLVTERGHGRRILVKGAIEFLVGGKTIVSPRCVEHIEGSLHLREELASQLEGTGFVHGLDGGYDVVFGGLDCRLVCVDFVFVGCHNLDWDFLGRSLSLDDVGALIVKDEEGWYVALLLELGVYGTLLKAVTMFALSRVFVDRNKIVFSL